MPHQSIPHQRMPLRIGAWQPERLRYGRSGQGGLRGSHESCGDGRGAIINGMRVRELAEWLGGPPQRGGGEGKSAGGAPGSAGGGGGGGRRGGGGRGGVSAGG